jgi:Immunity protein Imm1
MKYRLRLNGNEYFVTSSQELKQLLNTAVGQVPAQFELAQIHEPERKPKLITRLLAPILKLDLSLIDIEDEISGAINGNLAVLFYIEKRGHHLHSVSSDYAGPEDSVVDLSSITGEEIRHPRKWVIPTEKAIEAVLRFYEGEKRPDCLQWVKFDYEVQ